MFRCSIICKFGERVFGNPHFNISLPDGLHFPTQVFPSWCWLTTHHSVSFWIPGWNVQSWITGVRLVPLGTLICVTVFLKDRITTPEIFFERMWLCLSSQNRLLAKIHSIREGCSISVPDPSCNTHFVKYNAPILCKQIKIIGFYFSTV